MSGKNEVIMEICLKNDATTSTKLVDNSYYFTSVLYFKSSEYTKLYS